MAGVALNFTPIDPVRALYWNSVVNGVLAAPVMAVLMLIVGKSTGHGAADRIPGHASLRLP